MFCLKTGTLSLWSSGCSGTHNVDQVGLELTRDPPASASSVLGLKVCATLTGHSWSLLEAGEMAIDSKASVCMRKTEFRSSAPPQKSVWQCMPHICNPSAERLGTDRSPEITG